MAQLVDLLVDLGFFLDVEVVARHIRLGLVVVVVGDEVLDRVLGQQLAELGVQLRGQRLVMGQHQRRPLQLLDDMGHHEGLAGAGGAEQRLMLLAAAQPVDELRDRLRLVAGRLEVGDDLKVWHS